MADNIAVTAGAGTTVATEDVSGVHHQKVKVEFGSDGVATMVDASNPLPVDDAAAGTALDLANTTLELISDAVNTALTSLPHEALDTTLDLTRVLVDFTSTSDQTIVSATASQTTRVHRLDLWFAGAVTLNIYSGTSGGTLIGKLLVPSAGHYRLDFDARPHLVTGTNEALTFDASASVNIVGYVDYVKS